MKKKFSLTLISILSVVVLVGVGFAAWIITTPNVKEQQTGTITASGVTDARYKLTAAITNGSIVFGKPSDYDDNNSNNSDWFKPGSDVGDEKLTATLTLTLTKPDDTVLDEEVFNNHLPNTFTFTMNATKPGSGEETTVGANDDFNHAVSKNHVKNPTISYGAVSDTVTLGTAINIAKDAFTKGADNKYTLTITITFAWGTAFTDATHTNPYDYFNNLPYDDVNAKKALELNAMQGKINGISYVVTIASKANAQQTV
ncbi:unknown [Firmicutes bacterium CAG:552]|nr:unknown [Firmicutes bacterium CAG:552]